MRFHVLGVGSIGTLVAHHLRLGNASSPISLITKKARHVPSTRIEPYGAADSDPTTLRVERDRQLVPSTNYEIERWHDGTIEKRLMAKGHDPPIRPGHTEFDPHPPNADIKSLVVCLKTTQTVEAIALLRPRLSPSSVITLIQNGMGIYDELCASIWPDPTTRPFFILGSTTHGAWRKDEYKPKQGPKGKEDRWSIVHATRPGAGDIRFGIVPDPRAEVNFEQWIWGTTVSTSPILAPPASPPIPLSPAPKIETDLEPMKRTVEALLSLSELTPSLLPMPHMHHQLLLKLAINSVINPLTAILGAGSLPNGALISTPTSFGLIRQLAKETSNVLQVYLGSLSDPHAPPPDVLRLFSADSIERRTLEVIRSTSKNLSSMAADVSNGRTSEIDNINGYLRSLGRRLGVATPHHDMVTTMVRYTSEINGLSPSMPQEVINRMSAKRGWLEKQWKQGGKTARQLEAIEKELELAERQTLLKEKEFMLEQKAWKTKIQIQRDEGDRVEKSQLWVELQREIRTAIKEGREGAEALRVPKDRRDQREMIRQLRAGEPVVLKSREDRREAFHRRRLETEEAGGTKAQRGQSGSGLRQSAVEGGESASSSTRTPPHIFIDAPESAAPKVGSAAWMDQMIASAPRQERTWDVPASPPTARGPVPKKRAASQGTAGLTSAAETCSSGSTSTSPASTSAATTDSPPAAATQAPSMQEMMSSMIASAPRQDTTTSSAESSNSTTASPTSSSSKTNAPSQPEHPFIPKQSSSGSPFGSSIDSLISSAPRATRSWETKGGTITGYTSSAPSLASTVGTARIQGRDLARGGIGSALDSLISASPRQERTWDVEVGARPEGAKDKGRFSTSRTSGS